MKRLTPVIFALAYFFLCMTASLWASIKEPPMVRMSFVIFGFIFFFHGYLTYFYPITNFSQAERKHEQQRIKPSIPKPLHIVGYATIGLFWGAVLLWILWQRTG